MRNKLISFISAIILSCTCGAFLTSGSEAASQQLPQKKLGTYGMVPIYGSDIQDGEYQIAVESSSTMFRVVSATLFVCDGNMTANLTLGGTGYSFIFPGTAAEASASREEDYIPFNENEAGQYVYSFPVAALNTSLSCAGYSTRKGVWYDRQLLFQASSLPPEVFSFELPDYEWIAEVLSQNAEAASAEPNTDDQNDTENNNIYSLPASTDLNDGEYAIEMYLEGGSGKASITSPYLMIVRNGQVYARIQWSSSNYDYMKIGNETFLNLADENMNSLFEIPVHQFDQPIPVIADTLAMGDPREIQYSLIFPADSIGNKNQLPQEAAKKVVLVAFAIIILGGILNHYVKKHR